MTTISPKLINAYVAAADCLESMSQHWTVPVKLTLIVRQPGFPERDFLVSDDEMDEIIALVQRRRDADNGITVGG